MRSNTMSFALPEGMRSCVDQRLRSGQALTPQHAAQLEQQTLGKLR
jgi:hypothetical protein